MNRQVEVLEAPVDAERPSGAPFVLVSGGKGGVGKSTVAANVASALAARGRRVLLVDLDLGLANLHVLLGLDALRTVEDFALGRGELADCLVSAGANLDLVPAANGAHELARPDGARRRRLLDALAQLSDGYDVVIADAPAGIAPDSLAFTARADLVLAVTTPEPASLTDAYGLIKALDAWSREHALAIPTPELVVNQASGLEDAEAAHRRLAAVCERFLARRPRLAGWLPRAREVEAAIRAQRPVVHSAPSSLCARALERLADRVALWLPAPSLAPRVARD